MNKTINNLIQLQELIEIMAQHKAIKPQNHLAQLNRSIEKMTSSLPDEARMVFEKLIKTTRPAVVPIHDGACAGCGMNLPVSLAYEVKSPQQLHQCPACSRILFAPQDDVPVMTGTTVSRYGRRQTGIAKYSSAELMIPELKADSAEGAVEELCQALESAGFIEDVGQIVEIAMEREAVVSTAVDHGVAYPHARGIEGGGLTLALGKSTKGISFDESSDDPTHLIFFIAIPTAASAFYLKLLAGLTETLQNETNRNRLIKADTPKKLWTTLIQTTRKTIK